MRIVLAAGLAGALCLGVTPLSVTADAKTLVFCSEGNPESLNPQTMTTTTGISAGRPFFNNLVEFKPGSTEVTPSLAESWDISEDGTEYTFHLRHGVRFQSNDLFTPSREMNANDVIFSFERQWRDDHPYHGVGRLQLRLLQGHGDARSFEVG